MSEQILERSATGLPGDPGVGGVPADASPQRGAGNRTFLIVAVAAIAGLVLGGLFLFVMKPGAAEESLGPVPSGNPGAAAAAGGAAGQGEEGAAAAAEQSAAAAGGEAAPAKATTRLTSRDPFAPLVAKKPPAPPPAAPSGDGAATTGGTSTTTGAPVPRPASGGTISALSISPLGNSVSLKLDGEKYEVDEGEMFAKSYRLYDIFNDNCAGFLYGDMNAVVCEGDSVTIG